MSKPAASTRPANRGRLLLALRRQGPTPRVALARATGLSFAAVSAMTSEFLAEGILCEGEADASQARGRPAVGIALEPAFGRVVAISLRMNLVETLIADFRGDAVAQRRQAVATRALDEAALCRLIIGQVAEILEATETPRERLLGIGLAFQGMIDARLGRQLWSPALSVTNVDVAEPLRQAFHVPVVMANDVVALALAVTAREPSLARGLTATLMVGHGVGMGLLIDGEPALGDGGVGSEIGHVKRQQDGPQCRCGQRGCIEAYLADYALYRDARTFIDLPPADAQQPDEAQMAMLHQQALAGDPRLERLFRQAGGALADAVAATISVLSPRHVILSGPGLQAFPMMQAAYEERLGEAVLPWLRERTTIHLHPTGAAAIVDGMARRTLSIVDRYLLGLAPRQPRLDVAAAG